MLFLLRKIRKKLMEKNRFTTYLLYAVGEIILVVIGILIALQINNWNAQRLNQKKEQGYLLEIKSNLETDLLQIDKVLTFNKDKADKIMECFVEFQNIGTSTTTSNEILGRRLGVIGSFETLNPNRLGFENLQSAENIELISNSDLRKQILDYYSSDLESGTQNRMVDVSRAFIDYIAPKTTTKELMQRFYKLNLDLPSDAEGMLHKDQQAISSLNLILIVMDSQNDLVTEKREQIQQLIEQIDQELID